MANLVLRCVCFDCQEPEELSLPTDAEYSVLSVMITALRCADFRGAAVAFLGARADAPTDKFFSR